MKETISPMAETAINRFYEAFCQYMTETCDATPDQLMLDWNCVGATARFFGSRFHVQVRLWERSEGNFGIPDMTAIVYDFSVHHTVPEEERVEVFSKLIIFMKASGFLHIALWGTRPSENEKQVPGCELTCFPLSSL